MNTCILGNYINVGDSISFWPSIKSRQIHRGKVIDIAYPRHVMLDQNITSPTKYCINAKVLVDDIYVGDEVIYINILMQTVIGKVTKIMPKVIEAKPHRFPSGEIFIDIDTQTIKKQYVAKIKDGKKSLISLVKDR
jgi:hypothetical protein